MHFLPICQRVLSFVSGEVPHTLLADTRKNNIQLHAFISKTPRNQGGEPPPFITNVLKTPIVSDQAAVLGTKELESAPHEHVPEGPCSPFPDRISVRQEVADDEKTALPVAEEANVAAECLAKDQKLTEKVNTAPESMVESKPEEFDEILFELEDRYDLDRHNPELRARVERYARKLSSMIALQVEHAIYTNKKIIEIKGTINPINNSHPFNVFKNYILNYVKSNYPGTRVGFSNEEQSAQFLAQKMPYSAQMTIELPSGPLACDMLLAPLFDTLSSHGRTTGHMRYPQIYQDIMTCQKDIGTQPDILLIGLGLRRDERDSNGRVQCPQLYEVAGLFPNRSSLTALEIDPEIVQIVNQNMKLPPKNRFMKYDQNALSPNFIRYNNLRQPQQIERLIKFMHPGMELFAQSINKLKVLLGDLCTFNCQDSQYNVIIATNSISNAFDLFDEDPIESKRMLEILTKYVKSLKENGILYLDEAAITNLEQRLGNNSIERLIIPAIRFGSKSEVSLKYLDPAVEIDQETGLYKISVTLANNLRKLELESTNTHGVWALQKGKPNPAPSTDFLPELIKYYRQSLGHLCKKK